MTVRRGDATKITGITPKFFIKDDGTDYDTGEEYNGLWSGGSISVPTGYGSIGHWKFNEEESVIMFNNRYRGLNNLRTGPAGGVWSSDAIGKNYTFKLPGNEPLVGETSDIMYIMLGSGGSFNENSQWGSYLRHNAFEDIVGIADTGKANLRFMFDFWGYFRDPPLVNTQQILFSLYDSLASYSHVMTFCVRNDSGTLNLVLYYTDGIRATRTTMYSCKSSDAINAIYPNGMGEHGGLHHVSFIFDRESLNGSSKVKFSEDADGPEGFYVDGKYFIRSSGNTSNWSTALQEIDCNALIGCRFTSNVHTFTDEKGDTDAPTFAQQFTGKIYHISMTVIDDDNLITKKRMQILYGLKFNIPRGPSKVDFSERYEYKGENLLTELGNIKQVIEKDKGSFFITVQTLKAKN